MTDEEQPADRIARLEAALDASADENVRLAGEVADLEAALSRVMQYLDELLKGDPDPATVVERLAAELDRWRRTN
ncbi:MAG TPA: hypothetical protein PKG98_10920 [Myxococcota bacterium]|nr:hypothetical protein [Myxococcota bacterium]